MILWKVCTSILAKNTDEAIRKIRYASQLSDLLEIRLDAMESWDLDKIITNTNLPLIITYRRPEEGGLKKNITDEERIDILKGAIDKGVEYIDIELDIENSLKSYILKERHNTKIIISKHFFEPVEEKILHRYADNIFSLGADIGKVIGYASSWIDNFMYFNIVKKYSEKGHAIICFAMGHYGKPSRIMSPILGAVWTYAALKKHEKAAPGQLSIDTLKRIWEDLSNEH